MVTRTAFMANTYTRANHVPSLDLGAFDITVDPKKGRVLVTTRVYLVAKNAASQHKLAKFGERFSKLVPEVWNGAAKFVSTEPTWTDVTLKPEFRVEVVGIGQAHFHITVLDETEADHRQAPIAAVKPSLYAGPGAGAFAPRLGEFGEQATMPGGEISDYRRDIIIQLSLGQTIPMKGSPTTDPVGRKRLEKFAREVASLKVPRTFKSSRRPTLQVIGCGPGDRVKWAADAAGWLCACGVKNPITQSAGGDANKPSGVELRFDKDELKAMFPPRTASQKSRFQQVTVAHEYGHMLGLADEYLCMGAMTPDAMQDVAAFSAPELDTYKGGTGKQIANIRTLPDGTVNTPHIVRHQAAFVSLCASAGVLPPQFGSQTPSLMSTGMVFHPHHFVTVWEAIGMATGTDKWRIQLKS